MSEETIVVEPWQVIQTLVHDKDAAGLRDYLHTLTSYEIARAVTRLADDDQAGMLLMLNAEEAADLIESISDIVGADLIEELEPEEAAAIIDEMDSDHRVDLLNEMDEEDAEAILGKMDPGEAEDVRQLWEYPEDTAGAIMITEYLAFPKQMTVADVQQQLREHADEYADYSVQYVYVVDETERLVGVVRLRDMILARAGTPLTDIMIADPLNVQADATLDAVNQFFDRYAFVGVPVTLEGGQLVGVIRRGDAEEAAGERAERSLMRFGGIIGGEEFRSMPLSLRAFRRLVWLTINLGLSLLAASVILRFEGTVESVLALAFFIPVIANMSGCSGNQAVAVSIRELAAGLIETRDFLRVLGKELQAGVVIGVLMGGALGGAAYLLEGSLWLAVVVGAALLVNIVFALLLGGLTPLLVRKAGADPALAAPLLVTTVADFTGFLLVLSLAAWFLGRGLL